MSKLTRAYQKIFGGNNIASPTSILSVFGSAAAASPAYSSDPTVIQSLAAFLAGWQAATVNNKSPYLQDRNAIDYLITRQLSYMFQAGLSEWDATTPYYTGSWCQVAGICYISKVDNNVGNNPTTGSPYDTTHWQSLADQLAPTLGNLSLQPRAWVNFDGTQIPGTGGGALTINESVNITGVSKVAGYTSLYEVDFAGSFPDTKYGLDIQCGVSYNSLADFGRLALKQVNLMRFYSMANGSAQGQSSDCTVTLWSTNPLA